MSQPAASLGLVLLAWMAGGAAADDAIVEIAADPPEVRLAGPAARQLVLIQGRSADGQLVDLTAEAAFRSDDPDVAAASNGVVGAVRDGSATVTVEVRGQFLALPVVVTGTAEPRRLNFANDIVPILSRYGCNSGGCHGKAEGQNGFKLSVFGFDPPADLAALSKESRGRRVFPAAAERSLLLRKVSGELPHGGGVRIARDSPEYAILRDWIAAGLPAGTEGDPHVVAIEVSPGERRLAFDARQQLRVTARYSDGRSADVTHLAQFQSNDEGLAAVDAAGQIVAGNTPGQAAVMASFQACVDVTQVIVPRPGTPAAEAMPAAHNFIDALVYERLQALNIAPSGLADDGEFFRRVYLDTIGTLPTSAEGRAFLGDQRPDRRARLVDELLTRPEFNDLWALWWADLLRVDREPLGLKGARQYYDWIRGSLEANKPLDQFAREIVTAEGPLAESPAGNFYVAVSDPGQMASTFSQVFLGVRIACAQCHHHPFDRWSQTDYYGMQAFFAQVGRKNLPSGAAVLTAGEPETRHPRTGDLVPAHALGQEMTEDSAATADRRMRLAEWLTAPENDWFARNIANRVWARLLGRGLVEPVDDVRATNPPTNPPLLDALAESLVASGYDLRALIRTIVASRVYQQSSQPNESNYGDEQNYSRAWLKRMPAEVLLDAVCQATGVPEKFDGLPAGSRAIELWDSRVSHYFLRLFGRPVRASACECERSAEASVAQVLHLMNSPEMHDKLTHAGGRVATLVREIPSDTTLVDELYLTCYSRFPTVDERQVGLDHLAAHASNRQHAAEDLAWSLLNSLEFVFNH